MATSVIDLHERTPKGQTKVERYRWGVQDQPGEFHRLEKKSLIINDEYQRAASPLKVSELARNWSWVACGSICVGRRAGGFWVVDGQHRVLAALKRSDISTLPCMVFEMEEVAEEAQGFLNANANRKPVSAVAKHRAAVVAGDPVAVLVQGIFDQVGVTVSTTNDGNPNHVSCVAKARALAQEDVELFKQVFALAIELSRAENVQLNDRLLHGLWHLARNIEGGITPRLLKRLRDVGATGLSMAAARASAFFAKGGAKVYAAGMLEALNKGLQRRFAMGEASA